MSLNEEAQIAKYEGEKGENYLIQKEKLGTCGAAHINTGDELSVVYQQV
jgi:hypothetical protein